MRPDHPKQALVFFIEGEVDDRLASELRALIERVSESRPWTLGPPEFLDETDADEGESVRSVGGTFEVYSAWPPWNEDLPLEVDRAQFQETELLVRSLAGLSAAHRVDIVFKLDRVDVGAVESGEMTPALAEGLLGEWRRAIGL